MEFPDFNFTQLNETDIREEIIAPLLRHLGYRSGTTHNVIREQALSYPKSSLGRKKNNDPILRGRADYICEAHNKLRWVIEAKSPEAALDQDANEQSWTYANHPEIRGIFYCLSNGQEFKIFQTNHGPESEPIFECNYANLEKCLPTIENILSPDAIYRDHPEQNIDTEIPIGPGLRSVVRITSGSILYTDNSENLVPLIGLTMSITEGAVERNEDGTLNAYIETQVPFQSLQKLNEKLGLHSLCLTSESTSVSDNPEQPTEFKSITQHMLPQGETVLDLTTWSETVIPINIEVITETRATGHLEGNTFKGEFIGIISYQNVGIQINMEGEFNVHLS